MMNPKEIAEGLVITYAPNGDYKQRLIDAISEVIKSDRETSSEVIRQLTALKDQYSLEIQRMYEESSERMDACVSAWSKIEDLKNALLDIKKRLESCIQEHEAVLKPEWVELYIRQCHSVCVQATEKLKHLIDDKKNELTDEIKGGQA